jgi:Transposase DDE domain
LHTGEVLVADRAFGGWFFLRQLLERKVDLVIRRHQARTLRSRRYRSCQEAWEKPHRPCGQPKRSWKKRQEILTVRLVCFRVQVRGYRTQSVIVVTSLLDVKALPASAIAERSVRRWQVERHFRQIKTNLALDGLRGLSPSVIEREIWMHAIADNLVGHGSWLSASPVPCPSNASVSKAPSRPCRPGPIAPATLAAIAGWPTALPAALARGQPSPSALAAIAGWPAARFSPALPTISCPTAASPAPENDGRKILCSSPADAGGCAYLLLRYCDDRRFVLHSMALNYFDSPLLS